MRLRVKYKVSVQYYKRKLMIPAISKFINKKSTLSAMVSKNRQQRKIIRGKKKENNFFQKMKKNKYFAAVINHAQLIFPATGHV